jgi:hypothetical protein
MLQKKRKCTDECTIKPMHLFLRQQCMNRQVVLIALLKEALANHFSEEDASKDLKMKYLFIISPAPGAREAKLYHIAYTVYKQAATLSTCVMKVHRCVTLKPVKAVGFRFFHHLLLPNLGEAAERRRGTAALSAVRI